MSVRKHTYPSGRVVYRVRRVVGYDADGNAVQPSATFDTRREAEAYDAQLCARAVASRGQSPTLRQYVELSYWPVAERRLAATSLDTYERELRLRILPALGDVQLHAIDRAAVQAMVDNIGTVAVARKTVGTLKTVLNEAVADGLLSANPAASTLAMPRQRGQKRDNGLVLSTYGEILEMLALVRLHGSLCVQKIAYLGMLQGLRPEERYALDWRCVDMSERVITVSSAYVTASARFGGNQLKATKTPKSTRVIPMHPEFATWVSSIPHVDTCKPFIIGADGKRISPSTAQKRWSAFLRDNPSCPPVTIENMRHSFATAYLAAGGQIEVLSRLLGHTNIATTVNRYYRPNIGTLRNDLFSSL